jgi:hypothetical protein
MTLVRTLSDFHHWLLDGKPESTSHPHVIVLHGAGSFPTLSAAIAHYLNEYDDQADGHWMAMPPHLIDAIAADAAQRRLAIQSALNAVAWREWFAGADPASECTQPGGDSTRRCARELLIDGRDGDHGVELSCLGR